MSIAFMIYNLYFLAYAENIVHAVSKQVWYFREKGLKSEW